MTLGSLGFRLGYRQSFSLFSGLLPLHHDKNVLHQGGCNHSHFKGLKVNAEIWGRHTSIIHAVFTFKDALKLCLFHQLFFLQLWHSINSAIFTTKVCAFCQMHSANKKSYFLCIKQENKRQSYTKFSLKRLSKSYISCYFNLD